MLFPVSSLLVIFTRARYVRRRFTGEIPPSAKVAMAKYMPLDQLIWYYDDAQDSLATEDGL